MGKFSTYIFICLIVFSCKSVKEKAERDNPIPHWVSSQPHHSDYYIGVFGVRKNGLDYRSKAKRGALESLSSEISVNISGESVLKTLESNNNFEQEYKQNVTLNSTEKLEGFEIVDSWESETEYWVYYRLSKAKHTLLKKERMHKALELGKEYFLNAKVKHQKNDYREAFVLSIQSLESVAEYLDEPLKTQFQGREVYFATEVLTYLQNMLDEIQLIPGSDKKQVVLGEFLSEEDVFFKVTNYIGALISGIPLKCEHKAVFFNNYDVKSNEKGIAGVSLGKLNQSKPEQYVSAKLNFEKLLETYSKNQIVSKLISYIPIKEAKIKLFVRAPKVFVVANEKEFGMKINSKFLSIVKQTLSSRGFQIANKYRDADLLFYINTNTTSVGSNSGTYQVELNGNVEVKIRQTMEVVFSEVIKASKGLQLTQKKAAIDAFGKAEYYVKRRVIPKLAYQYFSF